MFLRLTLILPALGPTASPHQFATTSVPRSSPVPNPAPNNSSRNSYSSETLRRLAEARDLQERRRSRSASSVFSVLNHHPSSVDDILTDMRSSLSSALRASTPSASRARPVSTVSPTSSTPDVRQRQATERALEMLNNRRSFPEVDDRWARERRRRHPLDDVIDEGRMLLNGQRRSPNRNHTPTGGVSDTDICMFT